MEVRAGSKAGGPIVKHCFGPTHKGKLGPGQSIKSKELEADGLLLYS